jgi:hypothetical protein
MFLAAVNMLYLSVISSKSCNDWKDKYALSWKMVDPITPRIV